MTPKPNRKIIRAHFLMCELYYVPAIIFISRTDSFCKVLCVLIDFVGSKLRFHEVI